MRYLLGGIGLAILGAGTPAVAFVPPDVSIVNIRVGFDSKYKIGMWTPVTLSFENRTQEHLPMDLELLVADDNDLTAAYPLSRFSLSPGKSSVTEYVRFGRLSCDVGVKWRYLYPPGMPLEERPHKELWFQNVRDGRPYRIPPALKESQELLVVVGAPLDLQPAIKLNKVNDNEEAEAAHVESLADLPQQWIGYEGVDTVLLVASRKDTFSQPNAETGLAVLEEWVRMGGRVVLLAGADSMELLQAGKPLARFLPGNLAPQPGTLRRTVDLENYAESQSPVALTGGGIPVPTLTDVRGKTEVQDGANPIVVRSALGFGEVVFVGLPLDREPFASWQGRGQFLNRLLGKPPMGVNRRTDDQVGGQLSHTGLTDLAGHMRSALDQFEGVNLVPFFSVVALLVLFALMIGPLDYLLMARGLRRFGWTWLTFPTAILVCCLAIFLLARQATGDSVRINQVDLVDFDAESQLARGTSWFNIYSPSMARFDATAKPYGPQEQAIMEGRTVLSWHGQPGGALGGLDRSDALGSGLGGGVYRFAPQLDGVEDLPIQQRSSRSFTARWDARTELPADIQWQADEDGAPRGTVTSKVAYPLRQCLLAYGTWVISIPELKPGETLTYDPFSARRELRGELTGRRMLLTEDNKFETQMVAYDQYGSDPRPILLQMMFHEESGGSARVKLLNRYQSYTDLSSQLALGRGIFVAYADRPSLQVELNGQGAARHPQDRHMTCLRVVFPVARTSDAK